MSAIAGVYYLDGRPVDPSNLQRMVSKLASRGPDGSHIWCAGSVGLAHCMLPTTPEAEHERLPLVWEDGLLVLTADARIDNRADLISALQLNDRAPGSIADSDLILAAYLRWGSRCPEFLIGDFAFAIWDQDRREMFCARSPMGVKPLYYYYSPEILVFGSNISCLLCWPEVPRRINETKLADHLAFIYEDNVSTLYRDVYQLPSAHSMTVGPGGLRMSEFWALDASKELRLPSDQAYAEAFLDVFGEAVRCRLRCNSPVGANLSGGLDSSSIVALARRIVKEQGKGPLHTFSAVFPKLAKTYPAIDERRWIEQVVAQGDLIAHYVHADEIEPLSVLNISDDEPLPVPNLWLNWGCFRAAREAGVRVVMVGHDGDTVVSYGSGYLAELARSLRWVTLLDEVRHYARLHRTSVVRVLRNRVLRQLAPPWAVRTWRRLRGRQEPLFAFNLAINPEFARSVDFELRAAALQTK